VPGAKSLSEAVSVVEKELHCLLIQFRVDFLEVEGLAWNASGSILNPSAVTILERVATWRCSWTTLRARISELHQRLLERKISIRKASLSLVIRKFQLLIFWSVEPYLQWGVKN
jgi:hypothetical protein